MLDKYPLMNQYWENKRARPELINIPTYVLASMSTGLHTVGSLRCFEEIPHDKKWYPSLPRIQSLFIMADCVQLTVLCGDPGFDYTLPKNGTISTNPQQFPT